MPNLLCPPIVEIYLCDQTGVRIECLDYVTEYQYLKAANIPAPFIIKMPAKFDWNKVYRDKIIEIWRGHGPGTLKLDYCGFIRQSSLFDDNGIKTIMIGGMSSMDLLKRRIVKDYLGSAQSTMTGAADDLLKAIVKDQLGSDAGIGRDLTSVGGGFTIQADLGDGASIAKEFSYKNVLSVCQEISNASGQLGIKLYFDIVPQISSSTTGMIGFQFQTFTKQRGDDHSWDSYTPVYVGNKWGNFEDGSLDYDITDEVNYAYVLGQGEGESRETTEVSLTAEVNKSIWNRRECIVNANNVTDKTGDATARTNARTDEGWNYLYDNYNFPELSGNVVETPSFRYGKDWNFGDRVTVSFYHIQTDAMIDKVLIQRDASGEKISAKLETYYDRDTGWTD